MKKLASESIGNILRTILLALIILESIVFIITIIFVIDYNSYLPFAQIEQAINTFIFISLFIMYLIYVIWIYKVHVDMQQLNLNYPISPVKSVLSFVIPFYNLYGAWNVHSKLADSFRQRNLPKAIRLGDTIMKVLPVAYLLTFADRVLGMYLNDLLEAQEVVSEYLWLSVEVVFLALLLSYWRLYKSITEGVRFISAPGMNESEDESESTGTEGV
ncbi:hypothetical protein [Aquisalibacillus elongatus]|uniref:DUF4328 domain-containing protein n=1 Tax=Aquisalibacillus elongatus TaxID=485577 RepID=A0A3N5BK79_9BACI|nr:hypothetical protein [Aquisalibacillus elongatus]RPF50088.1 hypothetical protein EDC24_2905 [Aquisalibacillus elongatus]